MVRRAARGAAEEKRGNVTLHCAIVVGRGFETELSVEEAGSIFNNNNYVSVYAISPALKEQRTEPQKRIEDETTDYAHDTGIATRSVILSVFTEPPASDAPLVELFLPTQRPP